MVHAMVALCPLPVMPSRVWNRSPRSTPVASASMAPGWSPAGSKSETTLNGGTGGSYRGGVSSTPGLRQDYAGTRRGPAEIGGPSHNCVAELNQLTVYTSFFDRPL